MLICFPCGSLDINRTALFYTSTSVHSCWFPLASLCVPLKLAIPLGEIVVIPVFLSVHGPHKPLPPPPSLKFLPAVTVLLILRATLYRAGSQRSFQSQLKFYLRSSSNSTLSLSPSRVASSRLFSSPRFFLPTMALFLHPFWHRFTSQPTYLFGQLRLRNLAFGPLVWLYTLSVTWSRRRPATWALPIVAGTIVTIGGECFAFWYIYPTRRLGTLQLSISPSSPSPKPN